MSSSEPLVSILVPAFNAERFIGASIRSALEQTWRNTEIIVVDDGSTDHTLAAAMPFASGKVKIVSQKNSGAAAARNKAYSLCQGDYIQWLDADDLLHPEKVARQVRASFRYANRRILLSSAWGYFFYRHRKARFVPTALWCDLAPAEWMMRKMEQNLHMQTATWLVSRELSEAAGPWDARLLVDDDGEYFCRVILACDGIAFIPESRTYYRRSGASGLSYIGLSDRKLEAQLLSMKLHIAYLRSVEKSERSRDACIRYLQTWLVHFYPSRPDIVKQAYGMAFDLGGRLRVPQLPRKYRWLKNVFGWDCARRAQLLLPKIKQNMIKRYDKALYRISSTAAWEENNR